MCDVIFHGDLEIESKKQLEDFVGKEICTAPNEIESTCLCDVDVPIILRKAGIEFKWDPDWGYEIKQLVKDAK